MELEPKIIKAITPEAVAAMKGKAQLEDEYIEQCCAVVLDFVSTLDPIYATRIHIGMTEKGFSKRQFLGAMVGFMLDRSMHMETPSHPYFEPGARHFIQSTCLQCEKEFMPKVPGQMICSEDCGLERAREQKKERDRIEIERVRALKAAGQMPEAMMAAGINQSVGR